MLLPLPLRTVLAAILSLSVLAGCFDLEQTLSIDRERVDYAVEVRMDARLAAINQRQDGRRNFCEPVELPAQAIARGVKTETIERTINGDLSCLIRISGPLDRSSSVRSRFGSILAVFTVCSHDGSMA